MIRVHRTTTDPITAWRVRDALAEHPLLAGCAAQIHVTAGAQGVILDGWALDMYMVEVAIRLARRAAGHRVVRPKLRPNRPQLKSE
jgi:hypothetical protein